MLFVCRHRYDHPILAERLGKICGRISRDDRQRCLPYEGSGPLGCISVLAKAGLNKAQFTSSRVTVNAVVGMRSYCRSPVGPKGSVLIPHKEITSPTYSAEAIRSG